MLKDHRLSSITTVGTLYDTLYDMDEKDLLKLRAEIDQRLGISNLGSLNVEREILVQLKTVQQLQATVMDDDDIPANQRAQTANSVAAILAQVVKMQTELYNAERFKEIEAAVIAALKDAPAEVKDSFFERYERLVAHIERVPGEMGTDQN